MDYFLYVFLIYARALLPSLEPAAAEWNISVGRKKYQSERNVYAFLEPLGRREISTLAQGSKLSSEWSGVAGGSGVW